MCYNAICERNDCMDNIDKYYENTQNALPHQNVKKFIEMNNKTGNAIDLGCGTGRDTVFLIKNNWNVLAIDREDTRELIETKLNKDELQKFKFVCQNFENIELEKNNLVVSNFSIPFCSKNYFGEFWNKVVNSIEVERIFCRKLFWIKRFLGGNKTKNGIFIKRTSFKFI